MTDNSLPNPTCKVHGDGTVTVRLAPARYCDLQAVLQCILAVEAEDYVTWLRDRTADADTDIMDKLDKILEDADWDALDDFAEDERDCHVYARAARVLKALGPPPENKL